MIALNRDRVFSRLRSRHAKRSRRNYDKPPIIVQLAEAVSAVSALNALRPIPMADIKRIHAEMEEFQRLFRQLEAMTEEDARSQKCHEILIGLSRCAHSLASQNDLRKLFSTIPNSGRFGPNVRSSLPLAVGKLGRYYSACSFLIVAARRLSIFRSIRVESVRLPLPASPPSSITQPESSLSGTLDRILDPQTEKQTQRWAKSLASAEAKFCRQLAASRKTYKIHAEIQLLFYYEMHPKIRRPKVICSSKSACFLCDLFIKIHAKFYVARTHGVLYDKWMLPDQESMHLPGKEIKEMIRVVEQFNATLEDRIRLTLPMHKMPRFHPNESVFLEPALWTPSAISLATSKASRVAAATFNPAVRLRGQPGPVANVETFRSCLASSTTVDQDVVKRGWSSPDRTSSRPTLESGACSGVPNSASNIEMPATNPKGPLELGGRRDETINGEIGRASPASQYLVDRQTCASLMSPGSTTMVEPISKRPVRDFAQLDYSDHSIPISSGSLHDFDRSSPILCPGVVAPNYQPLIRGTWIEKDLPTGGPPVKLSTRLVHLVLSYDWAEAAHEVATAECQQKRQGNFSSDRGYLVKVKWLRPDEVPERSSEQRTNIVDLDDMDESMEETLSHGAASSSTALYIHRQADIVFVKFIAKE